MIVPYGMTRSPVAARLANISPVESLGGFHAEMYRARNFLTDKACQDVIAACEGRLRPSTIADPNGDAYFRTSSTSDLADSVPVARAIRQSIAELLGLPLANAETLQAQKYTPGQEFKAHCDWFRPGSDDYAKYCSVGGQRTWTAMAYMNNVEEGGETEFPRLDHLQEPEAGTLLMWNNQTLDGKGNPYTIHHARPVVSGEKYVVTLWFRERQWS